jgi:general secretion pathway protein J
MMRRARSAEHGLTSSLRSAEHGFESPLRSAEHGFESSSRSAEHGFTLIEMLIALAIFAMIAAAGVLLLRGSIDTQLQMAARLDEGSAMIRLRALLGSELASAQPRVGRGPAGEERGAMQGAADSLRFTHASAGDPGAAALRSVRYSVENGALVRRSTRALDGATEGAVAILIRQIESAQWRYRDATGAWSNSWSPVDARALPRAVELTVDEKGAAPIMLRFIVGPDGLSPDTAGGGA